MLRQALELVDPLNRITFHLPTFMSGNADNASSVVHTLNIHLPISHINLATFKNIWLEVEILEATLCK